MLRSPATRFVAPARYSSGPGAGALIGEEAARLATRVAVVHGEVGWGLFGPEVTASLAASSVHATYLQHRGYVTARATAPMAEAVRATGAGAVLACGGGRVLDAGKAVADAAGLPCMLVPTSPATCSGATAVVVDYDEHGGYLGSRLTREPVACSVVDTGWLAAAPDRLLVAGLVDALAKAVEVTSRTGRRDGAAASAAVALSEEMERRVFADGRAAVVAAPDDPLRHEMAELAVAWPAFVGGLASEAAKLAAAHAVHNALTHAPRDARVRRAIHGEVLAFGILTQSFLQGRSEAARSQAALFAELGCPADLVALGFSRLLMDAEELRRTAVRTAAMPSLRAAFPDADAADVEGAMAQADAAARTATGLSAAVEADRRG